MKKSILIMIALLIILSLAACSVNNDETSEDTATTQTTEATETESSQTEDVQTEDEQTEDTSYEFEFEDIDGNVHKLSDYAGKPVYLKIWASWCSVCTSTLEEFDAFAGTDQDFVILSVVSPSISGEKSKEEFIAWYKKLGYKNLTVLLDEDGQIIKDFSISAYPSQIIFDADGNFVTGFVGAVSEDYIIETMESITTGTNASNDL